MKYDNGFYFIFLAQCTRHESFLWIHKNPCNTKHRESGRGKKKIPVQKPKEKQQAKKRRKIIIKQRKLKPTHFFFCSLTHSKKLSTEFLHFFFLQHIYNSNHITISIHFHLFLLQLTITSINQPIILIRRGIQLFIKTNLRIYHLQFLIITTTTFIFFSFIFTTCTNPLFSHFSLFFIFLLKLFSNRQLY